MRTGLDGRGRTRDHRARNGGDVTEDMRSVWRLVQRITTPWDLPLWQRVAAAVLAVAAAVALRALLLGSEPGYPYITGFPAVVGVTMILGVRAGIVTLLLVIPAVQYGFVEPVGRVFPQNLRDVIGLAVFAGFCAILIAIIGGFQATLRQLADVHRRLATADEEKGVLLREVTHRVQNHLASLAAGLRVQRRTSIDPAAQAALASVEGRVLALGRINARLAYRGGNASVDCKGLLEALIQDVRAAGLGRGIAVRLEAEDGHRLPIRQAVPIGLALNELLTNALKHAFPDRREGAVDVRFLAEGAFFRLEVTDDGIGPPQAAAQGETAMGSGTYLLSAFSRQLGGTFHMERRDPAGTRCEVTFLRVPTDDIDPATGQIAA